MIFIYIIFSAILFYYVLKYGIRNGFAELEANKDNLIYYKKSACLLEEIGNHYRSISMSSSKQVQVIEEAKAIYNESFDIILSEEKPKIIFEQLTEKKEEILKLNIDNKNYSKVEWGDFDERKTKTILV